MKKASASPRSHVTLSGKLLDATRVLFDLQQVNEIAQSLSGRLAAEAIAHHVTEGLVDCCSVPSRAYYQIFASSC